MYGIRACCCRFALVLRLGNRKTDSISLKGRPVTSIVIKENEPFEVALRRFRRSIQSQGLITEVRARQAYEKPTTERKRKKAAAKSRTRKRLSRDMLAPKLY